MNINDNYKNEKIAITAAVSIYGATLFVIFQFLIIMIPNIIVVFSENGEVALVAYIVATIIEIISIPKYLKKKYDFDKYYINKDETHEFIFNENILQIMFNISAVVGIIWVNFINASSGIRYFIIVINSFSVIYFIIFFIVRFIIENKIGIRAILSILIASLQIYLGVAGINIMEQIKILFK